MNSRDKNVFSDKDALFQQTAEGGVEMRDSLERQEIRRETRQSVEQTILETLELDKEAGLDNFIEKLFEQIKTLPRYQEIKDKLKGASIQDIPYELFKLLRRSSDQPRIASEGGLDDGVLIRSMRQGHLECAGRSMIASALLKESGIIHSAVEPPGHSLALIEIDPATLAYADYNNNLYFTFPRDALTGYKGPADVTECYLRAYKPRKTDLVDGAGRAYTHFIVAPAEDGVARTYLGNIGAAFDGREEMGESGITPNAEAAEAVSIIAEDILGPPDPVWEAFLDHGEEFKQLLEQEREAYKKGILDILKEHPQKNEFAKAFAYAVQGNLGSSLPHIQEASLEIRAKFAEQLWEALQDPRVAKEISRRQ